MSTAIAVKSYRERAGLTQAQLAKQLGVNVSLITLYETGRRAPSAKTAIRIEQITRGGLSRTDLRPDVFQ